jgi:transposase
VEETRRKSDADFKEGAVRLVRETGKPIAQVARELGIKEGTLGNWVGADRRRRDGGDGELSEDERAELVRLRAFRSALRRSRAPIGSFDGGVPEVVLSDPSRRSSSATLSSSRRYRSS